MSHFGTCYAVRQPGLVSANTFYQPETHYFNLAQRKLVNNVYFPSLCKNVNQ